MTGSCINEEFVPCANNRRFKSSSKRQKYLHTTMLLKEGGGHDHM